MSTRTPFHEKEYQWNPRISEYCPFLDIILGSNKEPIVVYADTGCTIGLSLLKDQVKDLDLGKKINDDPYKVVVGDGHIVGADIYKSIVDLNCVKKEVEVMVLDPENIMGRERKEALILLGRGFLDHFDVTFKGKERKITLFHPE